MRPLALLLALAGLVVGGVLGSTVFTPSSGPASDPALGEVLARLASIERELGEVRSIRAEISDLAMRVDLAAASMTVRERLRPEALPPSNGGRAEPSAAEPAPAAAVAPDLRTAVAQTIAQLREEEEARERMRREQQRIEQMERRLDRLERDLSLTAFQKDEVRKILTQDEDRRREFFERVNRGDVEMGDTTAFREEFVAYRDERSQRLQAVLAPEQYEKFQQSEGGWIGRILREGGGRGGIMIEGGGPGQRFRGRQQGSGPGPGGGL